MSFPSTRKWILKREQIDAAGAAGILVTILWGSEELCKAAFCEREHKAGGGYDMQRYDKSNRDAYRIYGGHEYADFRIEAFAATGLRVSRERLVKAFQQKWANHVTSSRR
jgi:hypothetical protein